MKVFIMTDLEGISMVSDISMVSETESDAHRFALNRLMLDTNAAVDGAYNAGASQVYVYDGHGHGKNFIAGMLDPRAKQLGLSEWEELMRSGECEAYLGVGVHAMSGTINGFLDHVQSPESWFSYSVNGRLGGEVMQEALFCGAFNIPLVMVSGDEAACAESRALLGENIACATVKYGIGRNKARCVPPDEALNSIRTAAEEGILKRKEISPYRVNYPADISLTLYRSDMCDELIEKCPSLERIDARTVRKTVCKIDSYYDVLF